MKFFDPFCVCTRGFEQLWLILNNILLRISSGGFVSMRMIYECKIILGAGTERCIYPSFFLIIWDMRIIMECPVRNAAYQVGMSPIVCKNIIHREGVEDYPLRLDRSWFLNSVGLCFRVIAIR